MLKIHSSVDAVQIHNLKNALETNGVRCEVLGEYRRAVLGEVPLSESFVELWILDDSQEDEARRIMEGTTPAAAEGWTCPQCGESIPPAFDQCWNCQTARPA